MSFLTGSKMNAAMRQTRNPSAFRSHFCKSLVSAILLVPIFVLAGWCAVGGSISGTIKDPTGGVIPGVMLTATNPALGTNFKATTDARGHYSLPSLPVGRYDLTIECIGFQTQKKTGLVVDSDSALELNTTL